MGSNLEQHRGPASVWERRSSGWDAVRLLAAASAAVCLVTGARRRSPSGLLLAMAGGALAWWSLADGEERRVRLVALVDALPPWRPPGDVVDDASKDSFPASDPPAWTSAAGGGAE